MNRSGKNIERYGVVFLSSLFQMLTKNKYNKTVDSCSLNAKR